MNNKIGIEEVFTNKFLHIYFHSIFEKYELGATLTYYDNGTFKSTCPKKITDKPFKPAFCSLFYGSDECKKYRNKTHQSVLDQYNGIRHKINSSEELKRVLNDFNELYKCEKSKLNNYAYPIIDFRKIELVAVLHVGGFPDKPLEKNIIEDLNLSKEDIELYNKIPMKGSEKLAGIVDYIQECALNLSCIYTGEKNLLDKISDFDYWNLYEWHENKKKLYDFNYDFKKDNIDEFYDKLLEILANSCDACFAAIGIINNEFEGNNSNDNKEEITFVLKRIRPSIKNFEMDKDTDIILGKGSFIYDCIEEKAVKNIDDFANADNFKWKKLQYSLPPNCRQVIGIPIIRNEYDFNGEIYNTQIIGAIVLIANKKFNFNDFISEVYQKQSNDIARMILRIYRKQFEDRIKQLHESLPIFIGKSGGGMRKEFIVKIKDIFPNSTVNMYFKNGSDNIKAINDEPTHISKLYPSCYKHIERIINNKQGVLKSLNEKNEIISELCYIKENNRKYSYFIASIRNYAIFDNPIIGVLVCIQPINNLNDISRVLIYKDFEFLKYSTFIISLFEGSYEFIDRTIDVIRHDLTYFDSSLQNYINDFPEIVQLENLRKIYSFFYQKIFSNLYSFSNELEEEEEETVENFNEEIIETIKTDLDSSMKIFEVEIKCNNIKDFPNNYQFKINCIKKAFKNILYQLIYEAHNNTNQYILINPHINKDESKYEIFIAISNENNFKRENFNHKYSISDDPNINECFINPEQLIKIQGGDTFYYESKDNNNILLKILFPFK